MRPERAGVASVVTPQARGLMPVVSPEDLRLFRSLDSRRVSAGIIPVPHDGADHVDFSGREESSVCTACSDFCSTREVDASASESSHPAARADRWWVGGLLGRLDGASHATTESQVARPITTRWVCLARELLDKSKSYQGPCSAWSGSWCEETIRGKASPRKLEVVRTPTIVFIEVFTNHVSGR